jgi:hypothetical protein
MTAPRGCPRVNRCSTVSLDDPETSVTYRKEAGESVSRILSLRCLWPDLRRDFR